MIFSAWFSQGLRSSLYTLDRFMPKIIFLRGLKLDVIIIEGRGRARRAGGTTKRRDAPPLFTALCAFQSGVHNPFYGLEIV